MGSDFFELERRSSNENQLFLGWGDRVTNKTNHGKPFFGDLVSIFDPNRTNLAMRKPRIWLIEKFSLIHVKFLEIDISYSIYTLIQFRKIIFSDISKLDKREFFQLSIKKNLDALSVRDCCGNLIVYEQTAIFDWCRFWQVWLRFYLKLIKAKGSEVLKYRMIRLSWKVKWISKLLLNFFRLLGSPPHV